MDKQKQNAFRSKQKKNNKQKSLDVRMNMILPPADVVSRWHELSAQNSFKQQAFAAYANNVSSLIDKELLTFMPSQISWNDFDYEQEQLVSFKDLGNGAFCADLSLFLDNQPVNHHNFDARIWKKIGHALENILLSQSSWQLLIAATYNRAQIVFIPKNMKLDALKLDVMLELRSACSELIVLIVEEGAQVALYDKRVVTNGLHVRLFMAMVGTDARVIMVSDEAHMNAFSIHFEDWSLGARSHVTTINGLTGGKQTWGCKDFVMQGEGAQLEHLSLNALKNTEQASLVSRQRHEAVRTKSSFYVNSLLLEEARSFYRGTISMNEEAKHSEADQQQRALILGPLARTCAIPSLEVATHEVRCNHGSAVGRFNKDELWYLLSRGFDELAAYAVLIEGFINSHPLIREHELLLSSMLKRIKEYSKCVLEPR